MNTTKFTHNPTSDLSSELIYMTSDVVAAYLSNNVIDKQELPDVIKTVYSALHALHSDRPEIYAGMQPAVPVKKSITPDYLICLEDGKKLKMLKRHLRTVYNLSPEQYKQKWNLPADYPMVSPNYAKRRSQFAKTFGLGRKPGESPKRKKQQIKAA